MGGRIPERWEKYQALGSIIKGTRFVAFKCPLQDYSSERNSSALMAVMSHVIKMWRTTNWSDEILDKSLCIRLPPSRRFTPSVLLEQIKDIGLIVDLTNTARYYNAQMEFINRGVEYRKIFCEGKVIPSQKVLQSFYDAVDNFIRQNDNNKLIGVHCTHGINRTGYVVCSYMIHRLGIQPSLAITEFNNARGYNIERTNYIDALQNGHNDNKQIDQQPSPVDRDTNHDRSRRLWHEENRRLNRPMSRPPPRIPSLLSFRPHPPPVPFVNRRPFYDRHESPFQSGNFHSLQTHWRPNYNEYGRCQQQQLPPPLYSNFYDNIQEDRHSQKRPDQFYKDNRPPRKH